MLKPSDIIDVIASSSPPKNQGWKEGLKILRQWGLKPRLAKKAISPWLFHANKDGKRASLLNQAFSSKDSTAVWMLRGGYGLQKLMPSFIKKQTGKSSRKKLFIGYSDGTALHLYLNRQKQASLHAPLICELPDLSKTELFQLKNVLFGHKTEIIFNRLKLITKSPPKILKATLTGGNLSLLSSSVGTAWLSGLPSCFLFIEDVNEADYKVDRMLHHLFYSGALRRAKALLIGSFGPTGPSRLLREALKNFSSTCNIPIILGLACGHGRPNQPLPFQTPAELSLQGYKAHLKVEAP